MSTVVRDHPHRNAAIVEIHATEGDWHGHYLFSTEGMSPVEVRAKHDAVLAHHRAKAIRHDGFNRMERTVTIAGVRFHLHGLAITEHGTDVRLILRVTTPAGTVMDLDHVAPSVADLPSNAEIVRLVRDAGIAWINRAQVAQNHVNGVRQILGV